MLTDSDDLYGAVQQHRQLPATTGNKMQYKSASSVLIALLSQAITKCLVFCCKTPT